MTVGTAFPRMQENLCVVPQHGDLIEARHWTGYDALDLD